MKISHWHVLNWLLIWVLMRLGLQDTVPCKPAIPWLNSNFSLHSPFLSAHASVILQGYDNFYTELKNKDISIKVCFFQRTVTFFLNTAGCQPLSPNLRPLTMLWIVCVINLCWRKSIITKYFFLSDIIEKQMATVSAAYLNLQLSKCYWPSNKQMKVDLLPNSM